MREDVVVVCVVGLDCTQLRRAILASSLSDGQQRNSQPMANSTQQVKDRIAPHFNWASPHSLSVPKSKTARLASQLPPACFGTTPSPQGYVVGGTSLGITQD